jgi:hypothetical protein
MARKNSRKNMARKNSRKNTRRAARKSRRNTRRNNMMGGSVAGSARRSLNVLLSGANKIIGNTAHTAAGLGKKIFGMGGNVLNLANRTVKTASGTILRGKSARRNRRNRRNSRKN